MLVLLLVEAFLVFGILAFGVALVRRNKRLAELVEASQIDTMVNRYAILIICTIIRLVLDALFVYYNF